MCCTRTIVCCFEEIEKSVILIAVLRYEMKAAFMLCQIVSYCVWESLYRLFVVAVRCKCYSQNKITIYSTKGIACPFADCFIKTVVGWCWLVARCPPYQSFTPPPHQDNKRKCIEIRTGKYHSPVTAMGKTGSILKYSHAFLWLLLMLHSDFFPS